MVTAETGMVPHAPKFFMWKSQFREKKYGISHWEIPISCTTQEYNNVPTPYYMNLTKCVFSNKIIVSLLKNTLIVKLL